MPVNKKTTNNLNLSWPGNYFRWIKRQPSFISGIIFIRKAFLQFMQAIMISEDKFSTARSISFAVQRQGHILFQEIMTGHREDPAVTNRLQINGDTWNRKLWKM